jgi:hypothetical protein
MDRRRAPSAVLLLATAWAGAVAGHTLTYLIAVPAAGAREALLASTGHNYWSAAVAVALVLGLASAGGVILRHFRGGLRGERTMGADGVRRLAVLLGALQVGIFLVQETLERLDAGASITGLHTDRLLLIGVLVQILVAAALAIALFFLARASAAAGRALRRAPQISPARPAPLAGRVLLLHSRLVTAGGGSRAPPR